MNRQQVSKQANKQSGRQAGNKATHVQRVHCLIFFRLNDSHLIFCYKDRNGAIEIAFKQLYMPASSDIPYKTVEHRQSADDVVHWSLLLVIANHTHSHIVRIKPNSEKWNQPSTLLVGYDLRLIYLFIDAIAYTSTSTSTYTYTCQLNRTKTKSC